MYMKNLKFNGKNIQEVKELTGCHAELEKDNSAIIYTNNEVLTCHLNSIITVINGQVSIEEAL